MRKVILLLAGIGILGGVGYALAAPTANIFRNIYPETDSIYENGTSTAAWLRTTSDQFCLTGDSCITSWAGGSGISGAYASSTFPSFTYASSTYANPMNLLAGSNITITTSTPGQITIASTGGVSGGTNGYVTRWTSASALSTGKFIDNGTVTGVNATSSSVTFNLQGNAGTANPFVVASSTGTALLTVSPAGLVTVANNLTVSGSANIAKLSNLTSNGFVKTGNGDGTLSIDTATYLTANQTITLSGDVSGSGETAITTAIGNDKVTEAMLKVVDTPSDEDIFTYESTTGDFEWHTPAQLNLLTYSYASSTFPSFTYASSAYATVWNLIAGSNVTITTSTPGSITIAASLAGGAIDGTGTTGFGARFTDADTLAAGKLIDNGTVIGMNATSSTIGFNIQGTGGTNVIANFASSTGTSVLQITAGSQVLVATGARLTIPQGTAPTLSAVGDLAFDTTSNQLQVHDGTAARAIPLFETKSFTISSSTQDAIGTSIPLEATMAQYTVTAIKCYVTGGTSVVVNLTDGTNAMDTITCGTSVTDDDGSIANATVQVNDKLSATIGTETGSWNFLTITVKRRIDAD